MKRVIIFLAVLILIIPGFVRAEVNRFEEALGFLGLEPDNLKWDSRQLGDFHQDPFRFPWFDQIHLQPLTVPQEAKITLERFEDAKTVRDLIIVGAKRSAHEVARWPYGPKPEIKTENPLLEAIKDLYKPYGWRLSAKSEQALKAKCNTLSAKWQNALAEFIGYSVQVKQYRDLAIRKFDKENLQKLWQQTPIILGEGEGWPIEAYDAGLVWDASFMYYGAAQGALSVDAMVKLIAEEKPSDFEVDTPLGLITISSELNDHLCRNQLLIIDTKGDDTYTGWVGGNANLDNPFSVCIDVLGNDIYTTDQNVHNCCGSGRFGFGALIDMSGNDVYDTIETSQGSASFGVGILVDQAGDDVYKSMMLSQGAAEFGLGLLQDVSGNDTYETYYCSQGFGFSQGIGLIQDRLGDDTYNANDTDILFPSAQSQNHNTSMSQGAGYGLRAEFDNGHSMSGGCGILQDMGGNDTYSCGVFGQGVAYWHGMGILSDYEGNDSYKGTWYVQGSSAHFGIAYFQDRKGNDTYQATMATSIGVGHDGSLGFHVDLGGNDIYNCWRNETNDGKETRAEAGLVLGCGNANGMGFFVNVGGDDVYDALAGPSLGQFGSSAPCKKGMMRETMLNVGIFIDIGGKDTYKRDFAGNNKNWKAEPPDCSRKQIDFGIGFDVENGSSGPIF